jgi:FK506-binding nuclear protein
MVCGCLTGLLAIPSCKDDTPAKLPPVTAPANVKGPTREEVLARESNPAKVDVSDFEPIPFIGMPVAYRTPDGELWQKYNNGLMIQQIKLGSGRPAGVGQTVSVAYVGRFPGTNEEFDRSPPDKPLQFALGKKDSVIKGWTMALPTMRPGGKIKLFVPPELAYGSRGAPPKIRPNAALIFEMELVSATGESVDLPEPTNPLDLEFLNPKQMGPSLPATQSTTNPATNQGP